MPEAHQPNESSLRPNVKILVAVWGLHYINRFEKFALASLLAPGNIPALAAHADVELVILTAARDIVLFELRPLIAKVSQFASIRYIAIDDLIVPGSYSVTLTLAFVRGMAAFGSKMTSIYFIFWNADFVAANGSLNNLAARILAGQRVVLAGSFRTIAEDVEPRLIASTDKTGILEMSPRQMARLALDHMHITTTAKTLNQELFHSLAPVALFWLADRDTIIGRFYQIFMLCLRPNRVVSKINCFCDYSFIPEYCAGVPINIVQDSDDAFVLELQGRAQEIDLVRFGPNGSEELRRMIAGWSTKEHRLVSETSIVFHAADLGERVGAAGAALDKEVRQINAGLGPVASHRGHYYWVSGVAHWMIARAKNDRRDVPAELDLDLTIDDLHNPSMRQREGVESNRLQGRSLKRPSISKLQERLWGVPPNVTAINPQWTEFSHVLPLIGEVRALLSRKADATVLVVADTGSWVDRVLPIDDPRLYRVDLASASVWRLNAPSAVDYAFVCSDAGSLREIPAIIRNVAEALGKSGKMVIFAHHPKIADGSEAFDENVLQDICDIASSARVIIERLCFLGTAESIAYSRKIARLRNALRARGPLSLLWVGPMILFTYIGPRRKPADPTPVPTGPHSGVLIEARGR